MRYLVLLAVVLLTACGGATTDPPGDPRIMAPNPVNPEMSSVYIHWMGGGPSVTDVHVYDWYTDYRRDIPVGPIEYGDLGYVGDLPKGTNYRVLLTLGGWDIVEVAMGCPVGPLEETVWVISTVRDHVDQLPPY